MLSEPKYGWANISIGDWTDRCSYLTDVPFQLLEAMNESCKKHKPVAVEFDAEGWEYIIIFDWFKTHIITENDNFELKTIEVNRDNLAKELVDDILRNIDEWSSWNDYGDMTERGKMQRKIMLIGLCNDLMKNITSDDYRIVG